MLFWGLDQIPLNCYFKLWKLPKCKLDFFLLPLRRQKYTTIPAPRHSLLMDFCGKTMQDVTGHPIKTFIFFSIYPESWALLATHPSPKSLWTLGTRLGRIGLHEVIYSVYLWWSPGKDIAGRCRKPSGRTLQGFVGASSRR